MPLRELEWHAVEKVWGRRDFPSTFGKPRDYDEPVGEIWFADGKEKDLLVKHLFTSERLSIQVHPADDQARAAGYPCGKNEAWYVLSAEPGATVGIGFETELSSEDLRAASEDGSIEHLLTWHEVAPGQIFYIPAGTVHAIGSCLSVLEIQQNVDVTYRLYDYGRPRELQLEVLVHGPKFVIERLTGPSVHRIIASQPTWLMPVSGACAANDVKLGERTVWLTDEAIELQLDEDACMLIAYPGSEPEIRS